MTVLFYYSALTARVFCHLPLVTKCHRHCLGLAAFVAPVCLLCFVLISFAVGWVFETDFHCIIETGPFIYCIKQDKQESPSLS